MHSARLFATVCAEFIAHNRGMSADLLVHEGHRGGLELLHPCPHDATQTKYQALFDPDPMFDRYRMAFFMNAANQHGEGSDWLLGAMDITAEHIAQEWPEGSQLLLAARNTLKERQGCTDMWTLQWVARSSLLGPLSKPCCWGQIIISVCRRC